MSIRNNTSEFSTNTPIAEIPEKIKKFETELFNFDTEKERLQKLIVQYKKALNYVKREFTDLFRISHDYKGNT